MTCCPVKSGTVPNGSRATRASALSALTVGIGGVVLAWLAAILVYALTYANFELWEADGRLHATYGSSASTRSVSRRAGSKP